MARPQKNGMDYFPHDTDAVNDEKIEALRALYGNDGYAFYFILLERIYRTENAELDISDAETIQILARKVGVTLEVFNQILESSLKWKCFDRAEYEQRHVLTSKGIKKRSSVVSEKREKMRKNYQKNKEDISDAETREETPPETPQRKEKKSKVNESKLSKEDNFKILELFKALPDNQQLGLLVTTYNRVFPQQAKKYSVGGAIKARQVFEEAIKAGVIPINILIEILWNQEEGEPTPWELVGCLKNQRGLEQTTAQVFYSMEEYERTKGIETYGKPNTST
jgi:hypothetical protein